MRTLLIVAFGGLALAASIPAAHAAASIDLVCPESAYAAVTHTGDPSWVATNQTSTVAGQRLETVGGQPALVCIYKMFGNEYWIYRRPEAAFPNCSVSDRVRGFHCTR